MRPILLLLLRCTGVMWFWRMWHRHSVVIVMIHGVMDEDVPAQWVPLRDQLSRDRLDRCLTALGKRYRFVSLDQAADMIEGKIPVQPYSLALTFDDGYRNQLKHALPILAKHAAPAIIYVVAGHIDQGRPFWFDHLDYALQNADIDGCRMSIGAETLELHASDRLSLKKSYARLRAVAKGQSAGDGDAVVEAELDALAAALEAGSGRYFRDIFANDDWSALATWDEIAKADRALVTIGSHTTDHIRLAYVTLHAALDQCLVAKTRIERELGTECAHLCYPYGSFTEDVAKGAAACGYRTAVTTDERLNPVGTDLMKLNRVNLSTSGSMTEMLATVSGLSGAMSTMLARVAAIARSRGARRALGTVANSNAGAV